MKLLITTQVVDKTHPILGFFHSWILEFAQHFSEVHIICLQKGEYDLPPHVHVYSLGKEEGESRLKYTRRFYRYFWRIFFSIKVDYVFFHMGAIYNIMAAPFFCLRKFLGTEFYWWKTHGQPSALDKLARFFVDRIYTAIDASYPVKTRKKFVVGHAIDTKLFTKAEDKANPPVLLFIGRFSRSKRVEQVLLVAKALVESGQNMHVRLIGSVANKSYFTEIKDLVVELKLSEIVTIIEGVEQSQLVDEYQKAKVFMNPSDNDGLDKVVLEAMLCGAVPVTANLSFQSILKPYELFLNKGDIEGYVNKITSILSISETDYNNLAENLAAEVREQHSLNTITDRIFNLSKHG